MVITGRDILVLLFSHLSLLVRFSSLWIYVNGEKLVEQDQPGCFVLYRNEMKMGLPVNVVRGVLKRYYIYI